MKSLLTTLTFFVFCVSIVSQNIQSKFSVNNSNYCDSLTITVMDSSIGATSWEYVLNFYGDTIIYSNEQNPTFSLEGFETNYPLFLKQVVHSGNQSDSSLKVVTVPELELNSWIEFNQDTLNYSFQVRGDYSNYEANWDFGDGTTTTASNPSHTYNSTGVYRVIATLPDANVCGEKSLNLWLNTMIEPIAEMKSNRTNICKNESIDFSDNTKYSDSISWYFEGGTPGFSTSENLSVMYENSGTFDVMLIANNHLYSDTLVLKDYIQVTGHPMSEFFYQVNGKEVHFNNASIAATNNYWTFDDGNTSLEKNPIHTYKDAGTYDVQLIATNKCGRDTTSYFIHIPKTTAVSLAETNPFQVYPNPFGSKLHLNWEHSTPEEGAIQLVDLTGKKIWESALQSGSYQQYDLGTIELQQGLFILNIKTQNGIYSERIFHIE